MQSWADHNGCDPVPREQSISDEVSYLVYDGCEAPVSWYRIEGGGHTWPGAAPVEFLGLTTQDINASDLIWELFF
jgi:polyhydroxybutyrate depolymerase